MKPITVTACFCDDGKLDVDSMREDFENKLGMLALETEYDNDRIGVAVNAVFDAHPTATLNSAAVVHGALRALGADTLEVAALEKRIKAWLSAHTDPDGSDTGKAFVSRRGRGNSGYYRRSLPGQKETIVATLSSSMNQ